MAEIMDTTQLPASVTDRLAVLNKLENDHLRILQAILSADEHRLYMTDLLVTAVIQRSLSLIDGFSSQVMRQNVLCAVPLIRLQLDSVMRLYACCLVDDPQTVVMKILSGEPLNQVKTADGHKLSDGYLRRAVSKHHLWVDRVYKVTSGFIHLSSPHMISTVRNMDDSTRYMEMLISPKGTGREWTEDEMIEAVDTFTEATKCLLGLCLSWFRDKKRV